MSLRARNTAPARASEDCPAQVRAFVEQARREGVRAPRSGGLADGVAARRFPADVLARGLCVELEHTRSWPQALRITMDHLVEHEDYYEGLARMEAELAQTRWYRPNPSRWMWIGIAAAVVVGGGVLLWSTRARAGQRAPYQPPAPGEVPLRPPPAGAPKSPGIPMGPPGPLASKLAAWIDEQDDDELVAARAAMPAHWWEMLVVAAQMPTDPQFLIALNPLLVDLTIMPDATRSQLKTALVSAVGILDALAIQKVFEQAQAQAAGHAA